MSGETHDYALAAWENDGERAWATEWLPIETAPTDGTLVIVYAAPHDGLDGFVTCCAWHSSAGWCVDELRSVTHWVPLPKPPTE